MEPRQRRPESPAALAVPEIMLPVWWISASSGAVRFFEGSKLLQGRIICSPKIQLDWLIANEHQLHAWAKGCQNKNKSKHSIFLILVFAQHSFSGCRFFPPTAESFGVSAQIGSWMVRGSPEVRFHEGFTRVPPGFHEVLRGLRGGAKTKKSTARCWGYHLSLFSVRDACAL